MKIIATQILRGLWRGLIIFALAHLVISATPVKVVQGEGQSMGPGWGRFHLLLITDAVKHPLRVGQVGVYITGKGVVVCHRVIGTQSLKTDPSQPLFYQFKGDGNAEPDPELVIATQIIGRILL